MNGLRNHDGFFRCLGNSKELLKDAIPGYDEGGVSWESRSFDIPPGFEFVNKSNFQSLPGKHYQYVRFTTVLWDFRTGRSRYFVGKYYRVEKDGSIPKEAPTEWRFVQSHYVVGSEYNCEKFGGWADSI